MDTSPHRTRPKYNLAKLGRRTPSYPNEKVKTSEISGTNLSNENHSGIHQAMFILYHLKSKLLKLVTEPYKIDFFFKCIFTTKNPQIVPNDQIVIHGAKEQYSDVLYCSRMQLHTHFPKMWKKQLFKVSKMPFFC